MLKINEMHNILFHHNKRLEKYGESQQSLDVNGQTVRYCISAEIGISKDSSVLDVGCGFGDFYGFLKYQRIKVNYYGVDINENFIKIAKKRYPDTTFEVRDIERQRFTKKFDWVIGLGLTTMTDDNHNKNLMKEMFRICNKGVVIDFLTSYVNYKVRGFHYTSPEKMFKFSKSLTKRVSLRNDYKPFNFCLYLYKNDKRNKESCFIEYYMSLPKMLREDLWLNNQQIRAKS